MKYVERMMVYESRGSMEDKMIDEKNMKQDLMLTAKT